MSSAKVHVTAKSAFIPCSNIFDSIAIINAAHGSCSHQGDPTWATYVASQISPAFRDRGCTTREFKSNGAGDMGAVVDPRGTTRTWSCDWSNVSATWIHSTETPVCHTESSELWPGQMHRISPPMGRDRITCGESHQTTRHIVEECPLTAFPGGMQRLHQAGPDAVEGHFMVLVKWYQKIKCLNPSKIPIECVTYISQLTWKPKFGSKCLPINYANYVFIWNHWNQRVGQDTCFS